MNTFFKNHLISKLFVLSMLLAMVFGVSSVSATTPNSPSVDGTINTTTEWAADELFGVSGGSVARNLYVTWDANNLYIGITNIPSHVTIYFDTAVGGQQSGIFPGDFQIAANGGYEFAWRKSNTALSWYTSAASWSSPGAVPGQNGFATDFEISIPLDSTGLNISVGDRVGILVLAGTSQASNGLRSYWPNVTGNQLNPASFSQAVILENVGVDGESPGFSPTAVSLQSFTADNLANGLIALTGAAALILFTGLIVLRRRPSKA